MTEIRMTNAQTGGKKGMKLARFGLIPAGPIRDVANVYGYGAEKYTERAEDGTIISKGDRNWELGYEWTLSLDALGRHVNAFARGEDADPESGLPHLAHAVFHCLALMEWSRTHPELDDRSKTKEEVEGWGV